MIKLYHNNRCSKSRGALELLNSANENVEVFDLLKDSLTKEHLEEILSSLEMKPSELIRKKDTFFKENYGDKSYTEDEYLEIMLNNPRLIERPIVVKGKKATIGRPTELIIDFLKK
ncbi:arsenate reductase (glutaredoxin) [Riemerella anatipestifer]|uniref:arsenate reductase (glutaredoxin) n=1 Tax=Riemerella anatipestifer TaxID=34085 RepID=UPI00137506BA|nr:arsenate reductase (glutaredoxin) [Riemerella anatipestifer]MDY3338635.1 arsenate reductase (glutaredoxin) [Riemerella anatipestifer]